MSAKRYWAIWGLSLGIWLSLGLVPAWAAKYRAVKISPEEIRLTGPLAEREARAAAKEKELAAREEDLAALQKEVEEKLARLTALQDDVKAKLAELKAIKDKRFKSLVKVYGAMSATKLAPLLNKMKDATVAEILRAMKTEQVAKIMPKLDQPKAIRVSKLMGMIK